MATNFFLRCFAYFTTAAPYDRPLRTSEVVVTIIITLFFPLLLRRVRYTIYMILYYNTVYRQGGSRVMITHTSFSKISLITPPLYPQTPRDVKWNEKSKYLNITRSYQQYSYIQLVGISKFRGIQNLNKRIIK